MTLTFITRGTPQHPPVLFLHGFLGCAEEWSGVMDTLSERCFCIAPDLPGHGKSVGLADTMYEPDGLHRALVDLVRDQARDGRALLCGYSMGGRVAMGTALAQPSCWRGVLLESANPGIENARDCERRRLQDDGWAVRFEREPLREVLEDWYRQPVFASLTARDRAKRASDAAGQSGSELARAMRAFSQGRQPSYWRQLSRLPGRCCFLAGEADAKYAALAGRMEGLCGEGRRVIVPGAGHNVHREKPEAFLAAFRQCFMSSIEDR